MNSNSRLPEETIEEADARGRLNKTLDEFRAEIDKIDSKNMERTRKIDDRELELKEKESALEAAKFESARMLKVLENEVNHLRHRMDCLEDELASANDQLEDFATLKRIMASIRKST